MATTRKGTPAEPVFSADVGDLTLNTANQYLQKRMIAWLEEVKGVLDTIESETGGASTTQPVNTAPDGSSRVSQRTTLGDYKHHIGSQTLLMNSEEIGTGTIAYDSSESFMVMTTAADGDAVIHQSKQGHNYQSGNPQNIECTCDNFQLETNIVKRVGYFSSSTVSPFTADYDGLYLESDGITDNTYKFVIMKGGTPTASIARADWDDPLNGSGPSGINYNFDKFTIILFDFLWLGGSDFRLFVKTTAGFTLVHTYKHATQTSGVAMLSPIQPIRYEIRQTGSGSGTLDMICARVATEGGQNQLGITPYISTSINTIAANTAGTSYAVAGYRMQNGGITRFIETEIKSISLQESSGNNNRYEWRVLLNPTIAGAAPTFSDVTGSPIQEATGDLVGSPSVNTVTDGFALAGGYGSDDITPAVDVESALKAGSAIDGTLDEIWLVVTPSSNNQQFSGGMNIFVFL